MENGLPPPQELLRLLLLRPRQPRGAARQNGKAAEPQQSEMLITNDGADGTLTEIPETGDDPIPGEEDSPKEPARKRLKPSKAHINADDVNNHDHPNGAKVNGNGHTAAAAAANGLANGDTEEEAEEAEEPRTKAGKAKRRSKEAASEVQKAAPEEEEPAKRRRSTAVAASAAVAKGMEDDQEGEDDGEREEKQKDAKKGKRKSKDQQQDDADFQTQAEDEPSAEESEEEEEMTDLVTESSTPKTLAEAGVIEEVELVNSVPPVLQDLPSARPQLHHRPKRERQERRAHRYLCLPGWKGRQHQPRLHPQGLCQDRRVCLSAHHQAEEQGGRRLQTGDLRGSHHH